MAEDVGTIVQTNNQSNIPLQCPKLSATNYTSWSIMVESIMQAYGLWEVIDPVTGEAVEAKKNLMARAFVFQTLPEDVLLQVSKHKHVKDVWEALRVRYLGADRVQKARLQTLRTELEMLKMKESETIDDFSSKLSGIATKFKSLGSSLDDEIVVRKLLRSVPKKFLQIVASIEQYSEVENMSLEEAVGRLKAYEERIKVHDEEEDDQGKLLLSKEDWEERTKRGEYDQDQYGQEVVVKEEVVVLVKVEEAGSKLMKTEENKAHIGINEISNAIIVKNMVTMRLSVLRMNHVKKWLI